MKMKDFREKSSFLWRNRLADLYNKTWIGHKEVMKEEIQQIQDQVILKALDDVPFDGWTWDVIESAAEKLGHDKTMAFAVFPEKLEDAIAHFSDLADRKMLDILSTQEASEKIRDKIKQAVWARYVFLNEHKEATRAATTYWLVFTRKIGASKLVWQTADLIWNWAGDTSKDYNYYTKRTLLSGVITATNMAWLNDTSPNHQKTKEFLDRRIENVLILGKGAGKFLGPVLEKMSFLNKTPRQEKA